MWLSEYSDRTIEKALFFFQIRKKIGAYSMTTISFTRYFL
jgi:hypothetical protein